MMIISHNAAAFAAWRQVTRNNGKMSVHLERMATGLRINRGADDAAGLAISEKMRSQIRGVQQAMRNAQDGISMIQTAEGALQEGHSVLQRMRELLVQAANDTYTMEDRMKINDEIQHLKRNLDEISQHTEFNTMKLLDGSASLRISSSSNLVQLVAGENHLATAVADSMITQSSGALRLDMEISGGASQVQNSHIYNQINGTLSDAIQKSPESGKYSGLTAFQATGLKEESYVMESREVPFGGVYYVDAAGNETNDPNAVMGISSMEVTATPNIVAFGDYEITPAKEVPFMAIFDDYQNTGNDLIRGVDPTGRDEIDVRMDVVASQGAVNAQTEVAWTDIGGAGGGTIVDADPAGHIFAQDVAYQTDATFNTNLYTHFQVNALDPRDLLASDIQAISSYVSASGSEVDMELTYKSEAVAQVNMALDYRASAASQMEMELTFQTASDSRVGVAATYQAKAAETISFDTTYILPPTYNVTIEKAGSGVSLGTVDIGGMSINNARTTLNTTYNGVGIDFSLELVSGRHRLQVDNNHGEAIRISDDQSDQLGLTAGGDLAQGASRSGTLQDYFTRTTVDVSGQDIDAIAGTLNGSFGGKGLVFSVVGPADGTRITIDNTGSHTALIVNDAAGDSVETELGLNGYSSGAGSGPWDGGQTVFHNHAFEVDISNQFLQTGAGGFLETVQDAINAQVAANLPISGVSTTTGGGTLRGFSLNNGSSYRLAFSDAAGGDWDLLNMSHSINRGGNRSSNAVYHNHTFSANVSNQSLSQIRLSLRNALSTALNNDGIANPVTVNDVFQLENGSGSLDRIFIRNSGTADTRYQLKINSHSGAVSNELNLVSTTERGADYLAGHLVHHNNVLLNNDIGDRDLDQIAATLQDRLVSMLNLDDLANPGGSTFVRAVHPSLGNLNRIEIRNTAGANTSYAITLSDAVGGMANQLNLHNAVTNRNATSVSHGVYHEHTHRIAVGDRDLEEIRTVLQSHLQTLVNNDQIVNTNTQHTFLRIEDPPGSGRHRIVMDNTGNRNTSYQIQFSDHAGGEVAQQLGIDTTVNRADSHDGILRDYGYDWGVVATNSTNIEQLMAELNSHDLFSTAWVTQPNYTDQYYGRFSITNVGEPDAADEKRRITLRSAVGTGANDLLGGEMTLRLNAAGQTQLWQARDRIQVQTQYNGITNTGIDVAGSRTDWWWEGVDGDRNPLVADPNLGFTSLKIHDNTINASELMVGDAWSLFTIAQGHANHDRLDFHLRDGASSSSYASEHGEASDHGGGSYRFNNGVLDSRSMMIPQSVRMGIGIQESFDHRIQFGNTITDSTDAVVYKERYQAPEFDHYAHAYYGDDTTYFFENKGDWSDYIQNAAIWRQEDTNMSMLFKVLENGNLEVEGKGYNRDGTVADFDPVEIALPTGGPIEIGSVGFDDLVIGGPLTTGDKFVINIAARAGHVDSVDSHGDLVYTDANVAITGSPFRIMGSEMQYRFDEGAVNGQELNLLGYFVHPIMGGLESGYYTGTINMGVSGAGFTAGTRVDGQQAALLEVNYFGRFDHLAGALINDFYFAQLDHTAPTSIVIDRIEYDQQSKWNGSVVFEVLEVDESSVLLRGQAHLYDVDMQYRYEEDDYILLDKSNPQLTLFQKMGFEGITFTEFCFCDLSKLSVEDVFTLTLSANAEFAGENYDELFLFTEQYPGSMYPMGWRFRDGLLDNSTTTLKTFQIGPWNDPMTGEQVEGWVHEGQMTLGFKDFHGGTVEGVLGSKTTPRIIEDTVRFDSVYKQGFDTGTANRHTRLVDIAELYDATGTFLLDEPQFLQILFDGKEHSIWLRPDDRLLDVMDRINHTMYEVFGQKDLIRADQQYKFAYFTDQPMEQTQMARPEGSFMIQTALAGKQGEVMLNGNPDLVRILGMQVIRESSESAVTMTLSDAVRGTVLQKELKTSTNQAMMLGNDSRAQIKVSAKYGTPAVDYNEVLKEFTHGVQQANALFLRVIDQTKLLHIGGNQRQDTLFQINRMDSQALGLRGLSALTREKANDGIGKVDRATAKVSGQRSMLGALQNRLEHTIDNLGVTAENLTSSESRIRDADMAWEVMMLTKTQILLQTAQAMLSQANTMPNQIVDLLRGM